MHYFCSILTLEEVEVSENQVIYLQMVVFQEREKKHGHVNTCQELLWWE